MPIWSPPPKKQQKRNTIDSKKKKLEKKKNRWLVSIIISRLSVWTSIHCWEPLTLGFSLKTIFTYPQALLGRNERYRRLLLFFSMPPSHLSLSYFYRRYSKIFFRPLRPQHPLDVFNFSSLRLSPQTSPHKRRLVFVRTYLGIGMCTYR